MFFDHSSVLDKSYAVGIDRFSVFFTDLNFQLPNTFFDDQSIAVNHDLPFIEQYQTSNDQ